jgi:predicted dehydrogenase
MLREERPRLVSIAMRQADQHHAIALDCLRAGAHVYCEKPFTRSAAEADELLAEARRGGLKIAVAHTMRLMPQTVRLKKALQQGLLGEVRELRAYGKQDTRAGGEDMMVLGSHLFDLLRLFAGDPLWVTAQVLWQGRDIEVSNRRLVRDNVGWVAGDQVFAQFAFPQGVRATFTSDGRLRETIGHWGIELHGSKGVARINGDVAPNVFVRSQGGWSATGRTDTWTPLDPALVTGPPEHNLGPVGDWLAAIAEDREPECSGANGAWAVEMVGGVYAAALQRGRVAFPLVERRHPLGEETVDR